MEQGLQKPSLLNNPSAEPSLEPVEKEIQDTSNLAYAANPEQDNPGQQDESDEPHGHTNGEIESLLAAG